MRGRVDDRALVTVSPVDPAALAVGDVVLCTVRGAQYLHIVKAIQGEGARFLIGNNVGGTNGWTSASQVHGKLVRVDP